MLVLKAGVACYLDTLFSGLIRAVVLKVEPGKDELGERGPWVTIRLTESRRAYHESEILREHASHVFPCSALRASLVGLMYIRPHEVQLT